MLYQLHELQHASYAVFRTLAKATLDLYGHPMSPLSYTPFGRSLAAGSELLLRTTQRYGKPPFGLQEAVIDGNTVAVTEEIAVQKPFCNLLHFKRDTTRQDPVVLMVAPLSGHFATLLRDTVKTFLPDHDVYITDWVDAKLVPMSDGPFHFDDYVAYVMEFIRHLGPDTHVISVCQPTVPVLVALSLFAASGPRELPRSMIMMGGPIDTRKNPTTVNNFAKRYSIEWFERRLICRVPANYPGFMRRVYPGFLQHAGFVAMNPGRHIASHREYYYHLIEGDGESARAHRAFYDEYNAVLDLPAEYYLETVERVFQRHQLPMGDLVSLGERVRPELIEATALMTVEGELDDISGNGQTAAAHDLCSGIPAAKHRHLLAKDVGHYGIFSGRRFRENIYPEMREFIREQAQAARPAERRLRRV